MLTRLEQRFRQAHRLLSRSYWLTRLLGLPVSTQKHTGPGLVLVQIDGLGRAQLQRALDAGKMPFLRSLIKREHYHIHNLYSGLPSSTPAFQGEFFYGCKTCVPAFSFRDPETGNLVRMYEPDIAERTEAALEKQCTGKPLLGGGSAYTDIFTGGADEAHFCPAALGWDLKLRAANFPALVVFFFVHLFSFLRTSVYLVLELVLAIMDFFRGSIRRGEFLQELKFIPTRVAICILMRELCVIGAKLDINRGLPVIHVNFIGYDEQAHRRGPGSLFAHWTLKGIDDAIARLWRSAIHAPGRHYEFWVYSDHGQCEATPYARVSGHDIETAVKQAIASLSSQPPVNAAGLPESIQTHRVRFLGGEKIQRLFSVFRYDMIPREDESPLIAALGPVALVYPKATPVPGDLRIVARELVDTHHIPAVIIRNGIDTLTAFTAAGELQLPGQTADLIGADHPFLDAIKTDLARLCHHKAAGDLILLGWCKGSDCITFALENGSHGGLTPEETNAFCLLPGDAQLPQQVHPSWLRPLELRAAAQAVPGLTGILRRELETTNRLRVMTYNVHSCIGTDGRLSVKRIARVIARYAPDIVALQELNEASGRTKGKNQARLIARHLEMDYHFHPVIHSEEGKYGNAVLSHLPMRLIKSAALPGLASGSARETRGVLWVAVTLNGKEIQVLNTHFGLSPKERLTQVKALLGDDWLGASQCNEPVILCGDFNALPGSRVCRHLRKNLDDAQIKMAQHRPRGTYYSRLPGARIDHVYIDPATSVRDIIIPDSQLVRSASDHLPLIADLEFSLPGEEE